MHSMLWCTQGLRSLALPAGKISPSFWFWKELNAQAPHALLKVACCVSRKRSVSSQLDSSHSFLSALGYFLKSSIAAWVHMNSVLFPAGPRQEGFAEAELALGVSSQDPVGFSRGVWVHWGSSTIPLSPQSSVLAGLLLPGVICSWALPPSGALGSLGAVPWAGSSLLPFGSSRLCWGIPSAPHTNSAGCSPNLCAKLEHHPLLLSGEKEL